MGENHYCRQAQQGTRLGTDSIDRPLSKGDIMTMKQYVVFILALSLFVVNEAVCGTRPPDNPNLQQIPSPKSELNLKEIPFKIVYETYRKTNGKENWELYLINADGSNPFNLTRTRDVDDMFHC